MQVKAVAIHASRQTDTPERLGSPFLPACFAHLLAVGKLLSHVVQQKIRIGPDQLERLHGVGSVTAGDKFRCMAGCAAGCVKKLLSPQHGGITHIAALRHCKVFGVKGHEIENGVWRLHWPKPWLHAGRHGKTVFLNVGAITIGVLCIRRGNADIVGEGAGALVADAGVLGFPAKSAELHFAGPVIPYKSRAPGNAVAIFVIRIGAGQNVGIGNGLDQPKPKGWHCNPRRQSRIDAQGAIVQACHGIVWLAQHHHLAVGQPHGLFDIGDDRFALCGEAGNGNVLKLPAIGLVGKIQHLVARNRCPFRLVAGRPGQPQKQGDGIFAGKWRSASAVLHMAGLAGSGVIERPQPV